MLEKINSLYLEARKNKDAIGMACIGTLKGEVENAIKSPNVNIEDAVLKYCIKAKKNLLEFKPTNWEAELSILEQYFLPKQLDDAEISTIISNIINENVGLHEGKLMGLCMKSLKGVDPSKVKTMISEINKTKHSINSTVL